jgi:hypothetical protein
LRLCFPASGSLGVVALDTSFSSVQSHSDWIEIVVDNGIEIEFWDHLKMTPRNILSYSVRSLLVKTFLGHLGMNGRLTLKFLPSRRKWPQICP